MRSPRRKGEGICPYSTSIRRQSEGNCWMTHGAARKVKEIVRLKRFESQISTNLIHFAPYPGRNPARQGQKRSPWSPTKPLFGQPPNKFPHLRDPKTKAFTLDSDLGHQIHSPYEGEKNKFIHLANDKGSGNPLSMRVSAHSHQFRSLYPYLRDAQQHKASLCRTRCFTVRDNLHHFGQQSNAPLWTNPFTLPG